MEKLFRAVNKYWATGPGGGWKMNYLWVRAKDIKTALALAEKEINPSTLMLKSNDTIVSIREVSGQLIGPKN